MDEVRLILQPPDPSAVHSHASALFRVRFWGTRGSIATPGLTTVRYGGNTSAVQVDIGDDSPVVLLDCGTGARELGIWALQRAQRGGIRHAVILFGHFHWDHVQGLPFFAPLYEPDWTVEIWAPSALGSASEHLGRALAPPNFPVALADCHSGIVFRSFDDGVPFEPVAGLRAITTPLLHPGGCSGFRLERAGHTYTHLVDTEHPDTEHPDHGAWPEGIRALAKGADVLTFDAMFSPERYEAHRGWGHSTFEQGTELARQAGVRRLVLTHHDPKHDDAALDALAGRAQERFASTTVASEGLEIDVCSADITSSGEIR